MCIWQTLGSRIIFSPVETAPVATASPEAILRSLLPIAPCSGLSPPRRRRPRWPVVRGRGVWMCIVVRVSSFSSSNKVDLGFGIFFLLSLFLASGWDGEMGRGPCARIWVSMPSSGALLGGGVLPRRSCSCSVTPVLRRPAMGGRAIAAHARRLGHGGRDGFSPVCGSCCHHIHLGLHH